MTPAAKSEHAKQIERLRMLNDNCTERINIKMAKKISMMITDAVMEKNAARGQEIKSASVPLV